MIDGYQKTNAPVRGGGTGRDGGGRGLVSARDDSMARPGRQVLYTPDGKVCAVIIGGALTKTISSSVHMLRNPRAIALDCGAVQTAESQGVPLVIVSDRETGNVYRTTVTELYRHGWRFNRGYGEQIAMRLERWGRDEAAPTPDPMPQTVLQLSLL